MCERLHLVGGEPVCVQPLLQKCGAGDGAGDGPEGTAPGRPRVGRARGHTVSSTGPAKAKGAPAPQTGCPMRHREQARQLPLPGPRLTHKGLGGTTWAPSLLENSDL